MSKSEQTVAVTLTLFRVQPRRLKVVSKTKERIYAGPPNPAPYILTSARAHFRGIWSLKTSATPETTGHPYPQTRDGHKRDKSYEPTGKPLERGHFGPLALWPIEISRSRLLVACLQIDLDFRFRASRNNIAVTMSIRHRRIDAVSCWVALFALFRKGSLNHVIATGCDGRG